MHMAPAGLCAIEHAHGRKLTALIEIRKLWTVQAFCACTLDLSMNRLAIRKILPAGGSVTDTRARSCSGPFMQPCASDKVGQKRCGGRHGPTGSVISCETRAHMSVLSQRRCERGPNYWLSTLGLTSR
jgi:hypothetical protein